MICTASDARLSHRTTPDAAMTATAKLFTLGKSQAVRIPARFRLLADEVEITESNGTLILRPKPRTAADMFAAIRARGADWSDFVRPAQGELEPIEPLSL